ncbi:uncharacterized protein JCM15063_001171 [Sporobolomyces koalae]|uniref:uncharacterized protein n=1 Tax=Sporobolomyces koalae TaxID=500713 RepID=UPI00317F6074
MLGLVDYGSDSDSDSGSPAPSTSASKPVTASSLLNLPAPKSTLNLPKPASSTSSTIPASTKSSLPPPKKKEKGPVRILLDLPAAAEDDGPAKKKPKLSLGSRQGLSGLAAMLPQPKNESKPIPTPSSTAAPLSKPQGAAGLGDMFDQEDKGAKTAPAPSMFAPTSVRTKGKAKASLPPPPPDEPAVDFFGIGSVTASTPDVSSSASATVNPTSTSSVRTISSAPKLVDRSKVPKQPTAEDPYPGFTQLPSGEWVAKDQQTYELALQWQAQQQQNALPEGVDEKEVADKGGFRDVDEAQRAREAWATRPSQMPGKEEEYKKGAQIKGIPKQATQQARRKGQLSSLIAEAHDNRAELEERIAQARSNRKSAGNKYGF